MHIPERYGNQGHRNPASAHEHDISVRARIASGHLVLQRDIHLSCHLLKEAVHGLVHHAAQAQHRTFTELHLAGMSRIGSRTVTRPGHIHNDCAVGLHACRGKEGTASRRLLARGCVSIDATAAPALGGQLGRLQDHEGTGLVIQRPAGKVVLEKLTYLRVRADGIAHRHNRFGHRLILCSDVDEQVRILHVGLLEELIGYDADTVHLMANTLSVTDFLMDNLHRASHIQVRSHPARALHMQKPVIGDMGHPESDLVHMSGK